MTMKDIPVVKDRQKNKIQVIETTASLKQM